MVKCYTLEVKSVERYDKLYFEFTEIVSTMSMVSRLADNATETLEFMVRPIYGEEEKPETANDVC